MGIRKDGQAWERTDRHREARDGHAEECCGRCEAGANGQVSTRKGVRSKEERSEGGGRVIWWGRKGDWFVGRVGGESFGKAGKGYGRGEVPSGEGVGRERMVGRV